MITENSGEARGPTTWERGIRFLFHRWPLLSGCGFIASSGVAKSLVPNSSAAVWARVGVSPCLVPLNDLVGRAIFLVGDLDRKVSFVLQRVIRPGDTVLDVGANMGLVSLKMAQWVGPTGKVLSFEPSPVVLAFLRPTLEANMDLPIELITCALGPEETRMILTIPSENAGCASLITQQYGGSRVEVQVRRLSTVLKERHINQIHVMKVDVEGFEFEVLTGLLDDSEAPRPEIILFEEEAPDGSKAIELLRTHGYRLSGIRKRSIFSVKITPDTASDFLLCHDYIAVRADIPKDRMSGLGFRSN